MTFSFIIFKVIKYLSINTEEIHLVVLKRTVLIEG